MLIPIFHNLFSDFFFCCCLILPNSFQCRLFLLQYGPHVGHSRAINIECDRQSISWNLTHLLRWQLAVAMWGKLPWTRTSLLCDKLAGWLCLAQIQDSRSQKTHDRWRGADRGSRELNDKWISLDGWSARSNLSWMRHNERTRGNTARR